MQKKLKKNHLGSAVMTGVELHFKESRLRSIIKGLGWRVLATLATMTLVFIFTGQLSVSLGIGFFEIIVKLILYYSYERAWNMLDWGRTPADSGKQVV
ncbi:MAG: DUF2061 domain-containing protein [Planctomycetota bacterium]|jgi:uncharacterized membrane protein